MDMSVGRGPGMQDAVIAGSIVGAAMIVVPPGLLERVVSSAGLSEFLSVLALPIGWPVRIALALLAATIAAVLAGAGKEGRNGNADMSWTQSLGLHHLVRLARGEAVAAESRVTITPAMGSPRFRRSPQDKVQESLARHRADLHPDAPPRAPLMASRDLPAVAGLTLVEVTADAPCTPEPRLSAASPIRDTTDAVRARPLPRSPEPLSDSDLSWVKDALPEKDRTPADSLSLAAILPEVAPTDDSLQSMLDRFEQGIAHRIALRDAADAQVRVKVSESPEFEPADTGAVIALDRDDAEIDTALDAALETLKKLSAKANGR